MGPSGLRRVVRGEIVTQDRARRMRWTATGLLILMAFVFVLSGRYLDAHPAWGFVHAFSEAAMVGGLADWFAVTALFRHPLGLPIPHTAIIPENKDRIADTMAGFLRENFLTAQVVARRMGAMNLAGAVGSYLSDPTSDRDSRIRAGAGELFVEVLESLDPERLGTQVRAGLAAQLEKLEIVPLIGGMLAAMIADGRHKLLIDKIIRWAGLVLEDNEELVREMVSKRANAVLRFTGLDERLATSVIDGLYKLLAEVLVDPDHPLRDKIEEGLQDPAQRSRNAGAGRADEDRAYQQSGGGRMVAGRLGAGAGSPDRQHPFFGRQRRLYRADAGGARRGPSRRSAFAAADQPLRPQDGGGHRHALWRSDRPAGVGNRAPLGRAHFDRSRRRRRRPRPSVHPHQRHAGRRAGGRDDPSGERAVLTDFGRLSQPGQVYIGPERIV